MAKITIPFYCFIDQRAVEYGQVIIPFRPSVSAAVLYQRSKELFYAATYRPYVLVPFDCSPEQCFQHTIHRNQTFDQNDLKKGFALLTPPSQSQNTPTTKEIKVYSKNFSCDETLHLSHNILWSQFVFLTFKLFFSCPETKHYNIDFYYSNGSFMQKLGQFYPDQQLFCDKIFLATDSAYIQVEYSPSDKDTKVINLFVSQKDKVKKEDLLQENKKLSDRVLELEKLLSQKEGTISELSESLEKQQCDHKKQLFQLQQQLNMKALALSGKTERVVVLEEKLELSKKQLLKCKKLIKKN
jgi:uncharacterized coiled-coil protein SlyX